MLFKDNSNAFMRKLTREVGSRLDRVADMMEADIAEALGVPGPPSSTPGEFPRKRTGNLQKSVKSRRKKLELTVGPTAEYASKLENSGRKMAPEYLAENKQKIARKIIRGR